MVRQKKMTAADKGKQVVPASQQQDLLTDEAVNRARAVLEALEKNQNNPEQWYYMRYLWQMAMLDWRKIT